mmetsp:Transcript_577/g.746  ORF Transcript_577/g.746 Transcript_577/m.746 type:complete len:530 (+) Transcript_577:88-1677(+)|eukprot:CAMPEP_0172523286 /NCGR_PEP_ID=MMETSP1066-20121228/293583_1 /TAXON_ID=671091 /ORGANISM="Coscinodiscus wailesii, Strain CCMP2513" /LENGTH=529 /DNA_ID=CAMNT_0013306357 /DNA_START=31 /DNA_END=1620 /DNA_ORIENTATION=+
MTNLNHRYRHRSRQPHRETTTNGSTDQPPVSHTPPFTPLTHYSHTFGTLAVGIMIGYIFLPFLMINHIGLEDFTTRQHKQLYMHKPVSKIPPRTEATVPSRGMDGTESDALSKKEKAVPVVDSTLSDAPPKKEKAAPGVEHRPGSIRRESNKQIETTATVNTYSNAVKRVEENFDVLSSQSIATYTTPNLMKTPQLPDKERLKILVTGGAGFVGSHLVDKLMMQGHEVIVLDNFFTGQKRNVEHWRHHPNFSLIVHDVIEPLMLEVDQIYHLACPASPPHYQYNPVKTIKTSTMGTINMLGLAKRVKARILLSSTSEIYGDPLEHPQKESYWGNVNTVGPRSCYDEGKRVAETMMYSYRSQNNVEVRVARIFNTFGPRMHPNDGRVVSNFIIQSLQNKPLTVYGEGDQTRSFQYVSDLVEGLVALMNSDYDSPVNLGNPDEYSVKDFAEYIKDITKSESKIEFLPKSQDDPSQRRPDITTARDKINWSPVVTVRDGLEKTINYFRRVLEESGEIIPTGSAAVKPGAIKI